MKASFTIDVDTLNDYAYSYGLNYRRYPDPVYTVAIPRLLKIFKRHKVKATFFVVGRDLNIPKHLKILKLIKLDGHEIANHSFNHYHGFDRLSKSIQKKEIMDCHKIVKEKLNLEMVGFRAPGYNISNFALQILYKNNYLYDSSLFPTSLLPLYKLATILASRGKYKSTGGGRIGSIFSKPHAHFLTKPKITEVPISVTPIIRLPVMGTFNLVTGRTIFSLSLWLLKKFSRDVNYEFHPFELLDLKKDKIPSIFKRHPGSTLPLKNKVSFYNLVISEIKKYYSVYTMIEIVKKSKI